MIFFRYFPLSISRFAVILPFRQILNYSEYGQYDTVCVHSAAVAGALLHLAAPGRAH